MSRGLHSGWEDTETLVSRMGQWSGQGPQWVSL